MHAIPDRYRELIASLNRANRLRPAAPSREGLLTAWGCTFAARAFAIGDDFVAIVSMFGALVFAQLDRFAKRPQWSRLRDTVHHFERVSWQAIPIITLITFVVGAIIAQQGFFYFRKFGAQDYVVNLVGVLVLRELAVLIVSIMVAGRSGSAFTAELGSMKMREETDALRTMGLDPIDILALPRVVALVVGAAHSDLCRLGFSNRRRRACRLDRQRREPLHLPGAAAGGRDAFRPRGWSHQGAMHGAFDRRRSLHRRISRAGQRRLARRPDNSFGGEIDLSCHRARRRFRHLLLVDRNVEMNGARERVIEVGDLCVAYDGSPTLEGLSLEVYRGETLGVVGASGAGKSTLLRTLLGLIPKSAGSVRVLGIDLSEANVNERRSVGRRCGVVFQQGALFSSLSVLDNVQFPMREYLDLSDRLRREVAMAKIEMVGLKPDDARQVSFGAVGRHEQAG